MHTLDPIFAVPLEKDCACNAHLIPQKLIPSGRVVHSNRKFDNSFGHYNDHHLVTLVENIVSGVVDAKINVFDPDNSERRVTTIRTKYSESRGQFTIQYPKDTSDEWRERHLTNGTRIFMEFTEPDDGRIGMSMLHSAYLTACYHFGDAYVVSPAGQHIRKVLLKGVDDAINLETVMFLRRLRETYNGLRELCTNEFIDRIFQTEINNDPNPLLLRV
jgi:hypothetical protein